MRHSVIGFHYSSGGNKNGVGNWITNANSKGIPIGLKGANDYGVIWEAIQKGNQYSVNNWLVYRHVFAVTGLREVPNYLVAPWEDAPILCSQILAILPPEFDKSKVWIEPINEPRGKTNPGDVFYNNMAACDYLGEWMYAAALYLNARGYKVCGPSFNSGEPGEQGQGTADAVKQYQQPGMLKYLDYCAANPDKAALAVHSYVWDFPPPQYPSLWGRYEAAIAAADLNGISRTFPIFVTEWGFSLNNAPTMPQVAQWLDFYNQQAAYFPQVKFAASWTLQSGYSPVDNQVNSWLTYPIDKAFNEGQQPHKTHEIFGGTLPSEEPTMTLEQTLWNASLAEYTANNSRPGAIRYPNAAGTWKLYFKNIKMLAAHNEIPVVYEDKTYSIQGFIDPFTKKLVEVGAWEKSRGHFVVTEPELPVNPS